MTTYELMLTCLTYFANLDNSNAQIHTADVRYSPITFRLAEWVRYNGHEIPAVAAAVLAHQGLYAEDKGR